MPFDATPLPYRATVLLGALELLRTRGWCQGHAHGDDGRLCLFSAIREAGNLVVSGDFDRIGIPWPVPFNDTPGTTFEKVEQWLLDRIDEAMG
jgi:hypothetical protein